MPKVTLRKEIEISSQKIVTALKRGDGCLKTFAKKLAFTVIFIDEDDNTICPSCAQNSLFNLDECAEIVNGAYVKEEAVYCAICDTKIEAPR